MIPITLGIDQNTGKPVHVPADLFRTHFHLLGATGTGKTTAIHTLLHPIIMSPRPKAAVFLVDPMGNLSQDLLRWIASPRLCPDHVRRRLVYIEPAREDVVLPFNPLVFNSDDHLYYQVGRAVEIVLRAWASQNIEEMPRLRQWCFHSFFAVARMGYPIAACRYLLRPGSEEHTALLAKLPGELRHVWAEIMKARGNEAIRILESTRNRLSPFFDSGILRRMFASTDSRFDVERFIRERRIVILNVASYGRLDRHIGHTIGGLAVNEILQTAMNMNPREVDPTYMLLDEFQFFIGPDLYDALPTVRQLGLRLILAHQSFAQLERGEIDLSGLIWQARSRLMFANDADDADLIAHELATLTYDPKKLKEELVSLRQRMAGHRREWVQNLSSSSSSMHGEDAQESETSGDNEARSQRLGDRYPTDVKGATRTRTKGRSTKSSKGSSETSGRSETLVPIHEDFYEVSSRTYYSFDEQRVEWAKQVRSKRTGEAFGKFKDDPALYDIAVEQHRIPEGPAIERAVEELKEQNFASEFFRSTALVQREEEQLRERILREPPITLEAPQREALPAPQPPDAQSPQSGSSRQQATNDGPFT